MPYELTQIRIHMQRFMKEIGDVLTSPEDIARYEDFNNKMKMLRKAGSGGSPEKSSGGSSAGAAGPDSDDPDWPDHRKRAYAGTGSI